MKKPCIIIAGPTAVGKTEISIKLAKIINGAVISADSMQIYKEMNIGSAKITSEEMEGVEHYLIDELDPKDEFNVVVFQQMAKKAMKKIYDEGKIPVIVGGTGFYIQALLRDIDFTETGNIPSLRSKYEKLAAQSGPQALHDILKEKDPAAAASIHFNDVKRVIRALEYNEETGGTISEHNEEQKEKESPYTFGFFVITDDRQILYDRINKRVDKMMHSGLLEEVTRLKERGMTADDISMKGIGYREFFPYFEGNATLEETVEKIKQDTRHFAKRQITWFKREKDVIWFNRQDYNNDNGLILKAMTEKWNQIISGASEKYNN